MPATQYSRSTLSVPFGGALPETIPATSANSISRSTFARASAVAAAVGALRAFLASVRRIFSGKRCTRCCPFKQAGVAVQPVARRLIAASNGIDKIECCVTTNEVSLGKPAGFDFNR